MAKVKIIAKDDTGKEIPFFTKTLTTEFKGKAGKNYVILIEEPNQTAQFIGNYTVQGAMIPDPHQCQSHEHWDAAQQKCIADDVTPPGPQPGAGDLLYDSNTDVDWGAISGEFLKVTDTYGKVYANGKGFHMNASGNPRMYLYPTTKELMLEHDGEYGRAYFCVCNYETRMEADFMLETDDISISFKARNRHQFRDMVNKDASDEDTQGGQGTSFSATKVDADLEVVHGTEVSGPTKSLSPKLEAKKWYKMKFTQFDKGGKIHVIDELDRGDGQGFKVVNEGDVNAPSQFFNKAKFEEWSEVWMRMNSPKRANNRLHVRNLKLYKI